MEIRGHTKYSKLGQPNYQELIIRKARVTGESVRSQAKSETTVYDVVIKNICKRRLRWLGKILRGDETRLLFEKMRMQYHEHVDGVKGTLLLHGHASQ